MQLNASVAFSREAPVMKANANSARQSGKVIYNICKACDIGI